MATNPGAVSVPSIISWGGWCTHSTIVRLSETPSRYCTIASPVLAIAYKQGTLHAAWTQV
jgi:hypothetical protein